MDYISFLLSPSYLFHLFHQSLHATKPLFQYASLEMPPWRRSSEGVKVTSCVLDRYLQFFYLRFFNLLTSNFEFQRQTIRCGASRTSPLHPRTSSNQRYLNSLQHIPPLPLRARLDRSHPLLPCHPPLPNLIRCSPPLKVRGIPLHAC